MAAKPSILSSIIRFMRQQNLWSFISIGMLTLVILFSTEGRLPQLNRLIHDFIIATHGRSLDGDVIIVAIDDDSIAELGRWPWRRTLHAELLDRISAGNPKAIGLDVLFPEPEQTYLYDDAILAASIERNAPVVLPVFIQNQGDESYVVTPVPSIANAAAQLGLAHIKVDNDGIVRSVYLQEKLGGNLWNQFSVALLAAGGEPSIVTAEPAVKAAYPDGMGYSNVSYDNAVYRNAADGAAKWAHQHNMLVPYAGGAGHFKRVSYVDVIQGEVPKDTFTNKYVLIGATAAGIADQYATPTLGKANLMPGVEVLANITEGLLHDIHIRPANSYQNVFLNLSFVGIALVGFSVLSPFLALLLTIFLSITLFAVSYFSVDVTGILFSPAIGIIGLILIYPLWSWHRLSTATRFLTTEFESFQQRKNALFTTDNSHRVKDFLGRRITALEGATSQLRNLHRFARDSVSNLPDPTLITDTRGIIRIANMAAVRHFNAGNPDELVGKYMPSLIADVISNEQQLPLISDDVISNEPLPMEGEGKDGRGRDLIVKCVPIYDAENIHTGWILSLVDVSSIRQTERDREEAFRFITHDIRSPLSSIITILELCKLQPQEARATLMHRLERYADNALSLADNFVNLSRAKSGKYHFEALNLCDILSEAVDEAWTPSQARRISIHIAPGNQAAYALIDRHLFKRALTNLISNAIKFSPEKSLILCAIDHDSDNWNISITDHGAGIPAETLPTLFEPFSRLHSRSHPHIDGTGLGLAFVHSVAVRHGGSVHVKSMVNHGSTFHLIVPVAPS